MNMIVSMKLKWRSFGNLGIDKKEKRVQILAISALSKGGKPVDKTLE